MDCLYKLGLDAKKLLCAIHHHHQIYSSLDRVRELLKSHMDVCESCLDMAMFVYRHYPEKV